MVNEWNISLNIGRYYSQRIVFNDSLLILGGRDYVQRFDSIEIIRSSQFIPTTNPTIEPSFIPTSNPTKFPTFNPSVFPTSDPTLYPTLYPSFDPTYDPTHYPTTYPTKAPSFLPSVNPSSNPSVFPTNYPTLIPNISPTLNPTSDPTANPSVNDMNNVSVEEQHTLYTLILLICICCLLLCIIFLILLICKKKKMNANKDKNDDEMMEMHRIKSMSLGNKESQELNAEPDVYSDKNALLLWLKSIGLMEYLDLFIEQGFDTQMSTLSSLTDDDLISIGIEKCAHRKRILLQIENN